MIGDLSELAQARGEAINVVQWLARIANSYVSAETPTRRTQLEFRVDDAAVVTGEFDKAVALELRLPTLELQFLERGRPAPHVFDPEEHSPAELEAWILVELLHRGIDRDKFSKALPYTVPGLLSGDAEDYSPQLCRQGLMTLASVMQDAAAVLNCINRNGGGSITCLPENLNLVDRPESAAEKDAFAFSPGDAASPEPHFYLRDGSQQNRGGLKIKVATLMTEPDPAAAALKLKRLALA
jgi:hypothetical protein